MVADGSTTLCFPETQENGDGLPRCIGLDSLLVRRPYEANEAVVVDVEGEFE